jgi:hypothetical protein
MAYNLAQLAKIETEPLRKGILMNLLRDSNLLGVVPFSNVDSLRSIAVRWTNLPSVAWRRINEGYTPSEGDVEQVWEAVYGFGGEIKFDRVFDKVKNTIVKPKVQQTRMKLKAMALEFNDKFVNGDHASDADAIEGLKKRISNMPSRQSVYAAGSTSAALDPTASAANCRTFINKWEQAHYRANRGAINAILVNEGTYWGLGVALRYIQSTGNYLDVTRDSHEREIVTYKGVPLIDCGLKADQSTEIITETEEAGDGGSDATSAYFVAFNDEQGVTGIQLSPMDVYDPLAGGEQESTPTKLLRIDWWVGLAGFGSYGITRLRNFEGAANWT